jgi:hypothetical protein
VPTTTKCYSVLRDTIDNEAPGVGARAGETAEPPPGMRVKALGLQRDNSAREFHGAALELKMLGCTC